MSIDAAANQSGWSGLFWQAFKRSRNAMILMDEERRVVDVNGAFVQLLGYGRSTLTGRLFRDFLPNGPLVTHRQWHALLRRKEFTGEAHIMRADQTEVTVEFAGYPEHVTGKQLVLFVAIRTGRRRGVPRGEIRTEGNAELLSERELEVIELIALGLSGPEIADELHLAHNTVRTHVRNAMRKLKARSRAHLVAMTVGEAFYSRGRS
jgi:PAS domain S-box-containing protein